MASTSDSRNQIDRVAEPARPTLSESRQRNCTSIFHDVMRLRHTLKSMATDVAATLGLQSTEMSALDTLGKFGPMTMGELAQRSFISPPNTTRTIKSLVDRGLVERERSAHSRREINVSLTPAGLRIFKQSYPQMVGDVDALLADKLKLNERQELASLLAKLVE